MIAVAPSENSKIKEIIDNAIIIDCEYKNIIWLISILLKQVLYIEIISNINKIKLFFME